MKTTKQKLNGKKLVLFSMAVSLVFLTTAMTMLLADNTTPYVHHKSMQPGETYQLEEMESFQFAQVGQRNLMDDLVTPEQDKMTAELLQPEADLLPDANAEVPEPATVALLVAGGAIMLVKRRTRRG